MIVRRNGPSQVLQGRLSEFKFSALGIPKGPALIFRDPHTARHTDRPLARLFPQGRFLPFQGESTEAQAGQARDLALRIRASTIVGVGGGKCLDSAKWAAHQAGLPALMVPTSPATCSAWTGVMPVYRKDGSYLETHEGPSPHALLLDHALMATAPRRLVASGLTDALAKYYEPVTTGFPDPILSRPRPSLSENSCFASSSLMAPRLLKESRASRPPPCRSRRVHLPGRTDREWESKPYRHGLAHSLYGAWTFIGLTKSYLHGELIGLGLLVELALKLKNPLHFTSSGTGWGMGACRWPFPN